MWARDDADAYGGGQYLGDVFHACCSLTTAIME
jgi:hypothetical protein